MVSYTQLSGNGVGKQPKIEQEDGSWIQDESIGEFQGKIKCCHAPSLADLCWNTFDAVVVDEGVRMKGDATLIGSGVRQLDPKYRLVLTATPIKNRLIDIFWLLWWACGANEDATARFPYVGSAEEKMNFAREFMISERNLTSEKSYRMQTGKRRRFEKLTPQICNIHKLWKFLAPSVLRRRKQECGEEIVPSNRHVVRVPMGVEQSKAYRYHLNANYEDENGKPCIGPKLQALRIVAADPTSALLHPVVGLTEYGTTYRSSKKMTPKMMAALNLIAEKLERGEQFVVFSALHDALDTLSGFLSEASASHLVLDGRMTEARRGEASARFRNGGFPGMLAGVDSMSEGHSWENGKNVILLAYSWAYDKFAQGIDRVHRLTSPLPVDIYSIICDGSIDRKLEESIAEKGDAAELVLDGKLRTEQTSELNLAELLQIAIKDFGNDGKKAIDESVMEQQWPALKERIAKAALAWHSVRRANSQMKSVPRLLEQCAA